MDWDGRFQGRGHQAWRALYGKLQEVLRRSNTGGCQGWSVLPLTIRATVEANHVRIGPEVDGHSAEKKEECTQEHSLDQKVETVLDGHP